MNVDGEWDSMRSDRNWRVDQAGMGMLRIALLFGSAMVALALLLAPVLDQNRYALSDGTAAGLDLISTGSVKTTGAQYTIRRSVLQQSPTSICVIRTNGTRSGEC